MTECKDHGRTKSLAPEGYALVAHPVHKSRCTALHRLVYASANGLLFEAIKGIVVRHTCDNPRCIEPTHLIGGSLADNNRDRAERNRSAKFVPSRQKISIDTYHAIRKRYSPIREGKSAPNGVAQLAKDYKVDTNVIYKVIRGTYFDNDPNYRS